MATRHLRRLKEQLQQQNEEVTAAHSDSESEEEAAAPAPFNPFDLLTDEEEGPAEAFGDEASGDASDAPPPVPQRPSNSTPAGASSKKKKKSKKGKRKGGAGAAASGSDTEAGSSHAAGTAQKQPQEDIDAILAELGIDNGSAPSSSGPTAAPATIKVAAAPLLATDSKKLRGDDELRRIFGAAVVDAVDRQDAAESQQVARRRGQVPRHLLRRRPLRKSTLVHPREEWPWVDTGLSMSIVGTLPDGSPLFSYEWSSEYKAAQNAFNAAQAGYDPNVIAALLQRAPFHLDSLLAMYDLYRSMGEAQYAEEVLNRALYALEMAWHPRFDPSRGSCRLVTERGENKALFVALFRHAQALSRRGCHTSALEVVKLLLALDPEDPMGALLQLDYLALRAGQYAYLQRFAAEYDQGGQSLPLLPNYAYALALARFKQVQEQQPGESSSSSSSAAPGAAEGSRDATAAASSSSNSSSQYEGRTAQEVLVQALLMYPLVLPKLQQRLQGQGVGMDGGWQQVLARKLYTSATDGGSSSLSHLTSLFVERSHQLWRTQDVQAWLKDGATLAADIADGTAPASAGGGVSAADWAAVARQTFPADGGNDYSHLRLSDFSDAVNALPREELDAAMAAGGVEDLQAALDEQVAVLLAQQAAGGGRGAGGGPAMTEEQLREANPLLMLLQSLLPWVNAGQAPEYGEDGEEGGPAAGGGGGAQGAH